MSVTIKNEPTHHELQSSIHELRSEMRESVHGLEKSIQDVLQTMNSFAQNVEERFVRIEETTMATKTDLAKLETKMVTKEYLDEKLYDLRGDLVQMTRKEDTKLTTLVDILKGKHVIDTKEANQVLAMEPFSRN